jgi:hypothetical protein
VAVIVVPDMRQCVDCEGWQPRDAYHFAPCGKLPSGTIVLRNYCRKCKSRRASKKVRSLDPSQREAYLTARRATVLRYERANPGAIRARKQKWAAQNRHDPKWRERRNAIARASYWRRKEFGRTWWDEPDYEPLTGTKASGLVDAGPFLAFARDVYPNADAQELARLFHIDGSGARRMFTGEHQRVSLAVVDRALTTGLGRPDLLETLYPLEAQ